jgi:hypothetical protein
MNVNMQGAQAPQAPQTPVVFDANALPGGAGARTSDEVCALRGKRSELSDQIQSATRRRDRVAEQLKSADPDARAGLQDRLTVLDARIAKLEQELEQTGESLRNTDAGVLAADRGPSPQDVFDTISGDLVPIVAILAVFLVAPFSVAVSRFIWQRSKPSRSAPAVDQGTVQRLDQLQQAVDTIAIEVERISEGQRFVAKLMSEPGRALGAGAAEPIAAARNAELAPNRR